VAASTGWFPSPKLAMCRCRVESTALTVVSYGRFSPSFLAVASRRRFSPSLLAVASLRRFSPSLLTVASHYRFSRQRDLSPFLAAIACMELIDHLTDIGFDFTPFVRYDSSVLFEDITRTRRCLRKVENHPAYVPLNQQTSKREIDNLRNAIRTELSNDDATKDDATTKDATEEAVAVDERRKLGLSNAVFAGPHLTPNEIDSIPLYLFPGFRERISEHRAAIPVPDGYGVTVGKKCLHKRQLLKTEFEKKWSEELTTVPISNPSGLKDTPLLITVS